MEKINSFTYCDKVNSELGPNGPIRNIVMPLSELRPIAIPGNYSFYVACTISNLDVKKNNHLCIELIDPYGEIVQNKMEADIPSGAMITPSGEVLTSLNMDLEYRNTVLKVEGTYKTIIKVNNHILGEFDICVRKAQIQ